MYYYLQESFIGQNYIECSKEEYYEKLNQGHVVMIYDEVKVNEGEMRQNFEFSVEIPMKLPNFKKTK